MTIPWGEQLWEASRGKAGAQEKAKAVAEGKAVQQRQRLPAMAQQALALLSSCPDLLAGTFQCLKPTRSKRARELGCCQSQRPASQGTEQGGEGWKIDLAGQSINTSHSRKRVKCFQHKHWFFHGPDCSTTYKA